MSDDETQRGKDGRSKKKTNEDVPVIPVDDMTLVQLKDELKRRKLKTGGNKVDLAARLQAALVLEDQREEDDEDENDDSEQDSEDDDESVYADADARTADRTRSRSKFLPTFKDVEESIEPFTGDDGRNVRQWIKEFEDLAKLCEWNKVQKAIYAKRLLRGSARLFVKFEDCGHSWSEIKAALKAEFSSKVDSRAIHKELQRRKKKPNESYHEYCYKMAEIESRADVEMKAVVQYIIDGIDDEGYRKSILYGAKNIRELKVKFDVYEEMLSKSKSSVKPSDNKYKKSTPTPNSDKSSTKRCFNCGDSNHIGAQCPTKEQGTKCFRCNKYGHIAPKCTETPKDDKTKSCNVVQHDSGKCSKHVFVDDVKLNAIIDSGSD